MSCHLSEPSWCTKSSALSVRPHRTRSKIVDLRSMPCHQSAQHCVSLLGAAQDIKIIVASSGEPFCDLLAIMSATSASTERDRCSAQKMQWLNSCMGLARLPRATKSCPGPMGANKLAQAPTGANKWQRAPQVPTVSNATRL